MTEPNEYKQLRDCYRMRIMLTDFLRARIQEVENEYGELEKCVCIPIEDNGIYVTKGNSAIVDIEMIQTNIKSRFGWTHGVRQVPYSSLLDVYKSHGVSLPFIGSGKKLSNYKDNKGYKEVIAEKFMQDE